MRTPRNSLICLLAAATLTIAACGKPVGYVTPSRVAAGDPTVSEPGHTATSTSSPPPPPPDLSDVVDRVTAAASGTISFAMYDLAQGKDVASYQPDRSFPTESVVKLLIALDALDQRADPPLVEEMLSRSDDTTASRLWTAHGGIAIIGRMTAKIGLTKTFPPAKPGRWGDTMITAADIVAIYRYLLYRAPDDQREIILRALRETTHFGADGFDQYFGLPSAATDHTWAVKQGWACCAPSRVLNTTGLVDNRYVIVVLTSHPATVTWKRAADEITTAAGVLVGKLPK